MQDRNQRLRYGCVEKKIGNEDSTLIILDLKATALLKLIYLEMFGHDMSWAAFHVLEVMSSPKYIQKRVGYLGAVQSFRPDTEVLMLATNLLKKVKAIVQSTPENQVDRSPGYQFSPSSHHLFTSCDVAPCHHFFPSVVPSFRPAS